MDKVSKDKTSNIQKFIYKSNTIHNNKFDYSKSIYLNAISKIEIICKDHGSFWQRPAGHLSGKGCSKCKNEFLSSSKLSSLNEFIIKANLIHKSKYDYSESYYKSSYDYIDIICLIHGKFSQNANSHLQGSGCPKCFVWRKEKLWLDLINLPDDIYHRQVKLFNKIIVDGFDPITNTIYEFYGDYWHGNPNIYNKNVINSSTGKTFEELYIKTLNREKIIIDNNFNLIIMWEEEFNKISDWIFKYD